MWVCAHISDKSNKAIKVWQWKNIGLLPGSQILLKTQVRTVLESILKVEVGVMQ